MLPNVTSFRSCDNDRWQLSTGSRGASTEPWGFVGATTTGRVPIAQKFKAAWLGSREPRNPSPLVQLPSEQLSQPWRVSTESDFMLWKLQVRGTGVLPEQILDGRRLLSPVSGAVIAGRRKSRTGQANCGPSTGRSTLHVEAIEESLKLVAFLDDR